MLADLQRRVDAFSGVGRGHADVDDRYVGVVVFDGPHEGWRVAGLCDDFDAGPLEEFGECLADQGRVVGKDQAQRHGAGYLSVCGPRIGRSAVRTVGPPAGLSSVMWPPSASARSARPCSPVPAPTAAPPTPSSVIVSWRACGVRASVISI